VLKPKDLFEVLKANDISFFCGVPDSLLKDFCSYVTDKASPNKHIITANEGSSIALASGYYLATKKSALVYMQNSGLGNAINPLVSLADPEVYSIPILLMIGWRGEPGKKDEPQHLKQGRVMLRLLDALEIPYEVIDNSIEDAKKSIEKACKVMREKSCPYVLIIRKGTFESYILKNKVETRYPLNREQAIKIIIDHLNPEDIIVSTTGKSSREIFEYREALNQGHKNDFLTVGSMGHCSQIALGIALKKPSKQVYCLDGDGSIIMHMGGLAIIGTEAPENFKHIIINNGAHDSVGGQATVGFKIDFKNIAKACGYKLTLGAETPEDIKIAMNTLKQKKGPSLLEIRVNKGARKDLGRPTTTPIENKNSLINLLSK
jgi:phosphonopyruvate decarboxylase